MGKKRLIICCDGTWNWPDQKGSPTNVVKMVRAIRSTDDRGATQIVFYDTGAGTGNVLDRLVDRFYRRLGYRWNHGGSSRPAAYDRPV